jgi:hypothetical protein
MISFKTKDDTVPSVLIIFSIVAIVGVLLYSVLLPVPTVESMAASLNTQQRLLVSQNLVDEKQANIARAAVGTRLWHGDENHVGADVLAKVTASTENNNVKLTAFRPQRTDDLGGIVELPYTLQLTGPYPGIRAVMRDLDANGSKVVLRSVEVTASEEVTGSVTSTLGISAYISSNPSMSASTVESGQP